MRRRAREYAGFFVRADMYAGDLTDTPAGYFLNFQFGIGKGLER